MNFSRLDPRLSDLPESGFPDARATEHPLALPEEVWSELGSEKQGIYQLSQKILDSLEEDGEPVLLHEVAETADVALAEFLEALHLLSSMDLVGIDFGESGPVLNLLALPDEHIKIRGLDGKSRWVFVARPLDPPEREYSELN